jgi:HK97 family phage prohead protease/HK97 family phage major capsid protein
MLLKVADLKRVINPQMRMYKMKDKKFYLDSTFETKASKTSKSIKIAGYANTVMKDRSGDVVTAEAWAKGVESFRRNPIMLYQHKHDCPIGKFDKITIDKKGIYVEGTVSEAAERTHGLHTLIKDGALKSFSVGFRVKDGKYNRTTDSTTITDVELLEISIVSVPCNQDSLFSLSKSFDSDSDYKDFVKTLEIEDDSDEVIIADAVVVAEEISTKVLEEAIDEEAVDEEAVEEKLLEVLNEVISEKLEVIEEPIAQEEEILEEVLEEEIIEVEKTDSVIEADKSVDTIVDKLAEEELEEDFVIKDPNEPIPFISLLSLEGTEELNEGDFVIYEEKTYKIENVATAQSPFFEFLEVDAMGQSCNNTINVELQELSQITKYTEIKSEDETSDKVLIEELHGDSTKENYKMADQELNKIDLTEAGSAKTVATVSEPRVANLVEKTGEAILSEADAQDKNKTGSDYTPTASAEKEELMSQMASYREEIKALQNTKMAYSDSSRKAQFSDKEMANAVLLSKMLNKRDVFDTTYGGRMKAVTTVDAFISNFSENVYTEMEQQLVIAPMFNRMSVDAKTFRVPVADEDTDGDVAMFKSGTYATGVADATNVPTTNQHTMTSVEFTPHKFMATTHLAKDEEEDTVLPLIDFLRQAATRRLARAIDKSILRGTGALTGFTASPTNAISEGTGYASVIEGITNLTADGSLEVATGSATDKVDPSDIAAARTLMGKYGLQLGNDLVFVTSIEGYNNLVTTADFRTVDKFGPNATYLTGSVGAIYGIPIAISEYLDGVGTAGNHLGVLMYKPGFMIAERRGIEIESEYEPRQQVTAMYMSTRFDFKALTTNTNAALDAAKYAYATTIKAGV